MSNTTHPHQLGLARRELLDIPDVSGVQITCTQGSLWITLDHDPRDIVLEAGESFFSTEHRRALAYALEASALALQPTLDETKAGRASGVSLLPRRKALATA